MQIRHVFRAAAVAVLVAAGTVIAPLGSATAQETTIQTAEVGGSASRATRSG